MPLRTVARAPAGRVKETSPALRPRWSCPCPNIGGTLDLVPCVKRPLTCCLHPVHVLAPQAWESARNRLATLEGALARDRHKALNQASACAGCAS